MQQHFYSFRKSFAALFVLLLVFTTSILRGQTLYTGANNGDWSDALNWNAGAPSATNPPTVTGGKIVNINGTVTIDYPVSNFGTIVNVGTTTVTTGNISSGGALENQGTLNISASGGLTSSGGMWNSGTVNNHGTVNSNSAWTNDVTGVLNNFASFQQLAPFTNDGIVSNKAGLFGCPQAFTNNKTVENLAGATWKVDFGGSFSNLVGSILTNGGSFQNLATFTNNTTITNTGTFNNNGVQACTGIFNNENGATLDNTGTLNLTGRVNNKIGGTIRTSFRFNVLALGYVSNAATFNNNDQIIISLGGIYFNEINSLTTLSFGSKILNGGYLKAYATSTFSGNGEINNSKKFENFGNVLSDNGGKIINSDTLINYGLLRNVNIIDNSKYWENNGTIENNNGGAWTNTGTVLNTINGKVTNNYEIYNKPLAIFTNNGVLNNIIRFFNEGTFTNNGYLATLGDFFNKVGATLTNSEVIEIKEGSIVNEGTITNSKTIINSSCSVISNKSTINNTGRIENSGIVFQRGTIIGNAIIALGGWIQAVPTSVANICLPALTTGTDPIGEAKVYGQNPLLPTLGIDACGGFQYSVDHQTRAVYTCSQVGQTINAPFTLLTRTGDSLTCTIPITIFDGVPPVFETCPSNVILLTTNNSETYTWPTMTATDNCPGTVTITSNVASGSAFNVGITEVIITARDSRNNAGDCRFNVRVKKVVETGTCSPTDVTPPTFTGCPANITVSSPNGGLSVVWTPPSVSDACMPIKLIASAVPGQFCSMGVKTVTYTATDSKGNIGTCSFNITVTGGIDPCLTDVAKPVISNCPTNVFAVTNTVINGAVGIWKAPSAIDNCGFVNLTSTFNSGSIFPVGTTNVVYTATDAKNNASTCTFTITVGSTNPCAGDVTAPVLTACPANINLTTTTRTAIANWTAPTATDPCGGVVINSTHTSGSTFDLGSTIVTYSASDKVGNRSTCSFAVVVKNPCLTDTVKPVIAGCPADITTIQTGGSATPTWTAPTATDNCSTANMYSSHASGSVFPIGLTPVLYTAFDEIGNSAICIFNVSVQVSPVATCAGNILTNPSFETGFTEWFTTDVTTVSIVNDAHSGINAAMLCGDNKPVLSQLKALLGGTYTVTVPAKIAGTPTTAFVGIEFYDAAGVVIPAARITRPVTATTYTAITFSFTKPAAASNFAFIANKTGATGCLTIDDVCITNPCTNDVTPPTFTGCPANITINGTGTATTGIATWTAPVAADNCSTPAVTSNFISGQSFPLGATTVTYTATDSKGLTATCAFTVTFVNTCATDVTPPSFGTTCPTNKTGSSTNGLCVAVPFVAPTATDNCSTPSVTGTHATTFCFPIGVTTVVYTAADAQNNQTTCTFTVTVTNSTVTPVSCTGNLDANFSFESDLVGYDNWGATVISTTDARSGAKAAKVGTAAGGFAYVQSAVIPNATYTFKSWNKISGTVSWAGVGIVFYDANWVKLTASEVQATVTSTTYAETTIVGTAPANAVYMHAWTWKDGVTGYLITDDWCVTVVANPCTSLTNSAVTEYFVNGTWYTGNSVTVNAGTALTLSANPNALVSYTWTGPNGFSQVGNTGGDVLVSSAMTTTRAGVYTVVLKNANNCTATKSITVNVTPKPYSVTNCNANGEQLIFKGAIDYIAIGNTMSQKEDRSNCAQNASSSKILTLPAGAVVKAAYLYWSGTGALDNTVSLNGNTVVAQGTKTFYEPTWAMSFFAARANVTSLVQNSGTFTVNNLTWNNTGNYCQANSAYGAWSLAVVYEQVTLPYSTIHINTDKFQYTYPAANYNSYINCINVPAGVASNAKLTIVSFEGDNYKGENLFIGGVNRGNNNFRGQSGPNLDILTFDVSTVVTPATTSLNYYVQSYLTNTIWGNAIEGLFDYVKILKYNTGSTVTQLVSNTNKDVLDIEVAAESHKARIEWINNTGAKNDYFTVEKMNSTTGEFEKLEIVKNKSAINENEQYATYDNDPSEGDNIYRIKATFLDGSTKVSDTKTLTFKGIEGISLFPNPANDYVEIDLKKYTGLQVGISVYNQFGKLIQSAQVEKASATPFHLDFGDVSSGSYLIRVQPQGKREVIRKLQIAK